MRTKIYVMFLVWTLIFTAISNARVIVKEGTQKKLQVPGKIMMAYDVAHKTFAQRNYQLDKYLVEFTDHKDDSLVEIAFIPIAKAGETGIRGGQTSPGIEIHYTISLKELSIKNVWYGR